MQGHDVKGARGAVRTLTLLVYVPTQASDASPVAPRLLRRAFMSPRKLVPSLLVITCTAPWQRSGASFRRGVCCHARPRHALVRDSVARGERRSPSHHRDRLARIMRYDYERLCGPPRDGSYPVPRIPYPVSRIPYPVSRTVRVTEHFPAPLHGPSLQGIERRDLSIPGRGARYLRPQLPGTVRHGHSAIPAFLHMTAPTKGLSYGRRSLTRALRRSGPLIGCCGFSSRCPDGRLWQRAVSPDP
jgi:hypothetical protein